ncbi:MAG: hypothetical protein NVS4B11_11970 [Ktedonobacteraceae bacterium]
MIVSPQPRAGHTRLRDFVTLQEDISTLPTRAVASVGIWDFETAKSAASLRKESNPGLQLSRIHLVGDATRASDSIANTKQEHKGQELPYSDKLKTARKRWLSLTFRIGSTVALFALLLRSISWSALLVSLSHARHPILLIGLSIGALGVVISSYQWRSLLRGETIHFDLADLVNLYLVGTAFSHFLPTGMGGDAVKAIYVSRESGKNEGSASAVIMSRITGFFGMFIVAMVVLCVRYEHFTTRIVLWFLLLSLFVGGMIIGTVCFVTLLPTLFKGKWTQHRIFTAVIRVGNALNEAARRPRALSIATLYGAVFWIAACLNYYTYAVALGMHVALYFYFIAIPIVALITSLPISINGFGVRESAFVSIFSTVHVASPTALLLALLMDAQVLFFGIVGGVIYVAISYKKKTKVV